MPKIDMTIALGTIIHALLTMGIFVLGIRWLGQKSDVLGRKIQKCIDGLHPSAKNGRPR